MANLPRKFTRKNKSSQIKGVRFTILKRMQLSEYLYKDTINYLLIWTNKSIKINMNVQ